MFHQILPKPIFCTLVFSHVPAKIRYGFEFNEDNFDGSRTRGMLCPNIGRSWHVYNDTVLYVYDRNAFQLFWTLRVARSVGRVCELEGEKKRFFFA